MKKLIVYILFSVPVLLHAGILGDYCTWIGYLAGYMTTGERTTVQGAGAGGKSGSIVRTDYIGAAAGAYSTNVVDSVAIGYRAMRNAQALSNVVAIGHHAFAGATNLQNATWINGQVVVTNGTFYITADETKTGPEAPIWFDGEDLHISGSVTGGGLTTSQLVGFGLVVNQDNLILGSGLRMNPSTVTHYFGEKTTPTGSAAVYLKNNEGSIEVWQGSSKLGTLSLAP